MGNIINGIIVLTEEMEDIIMAATIEELKEMIVDLRMDLVEANIPSGNCPYAYYHRDNPISSCNDVSCSECKRIFLDGMRKDIEKEVAEL